ncbi:MAG: HutD family protein [Proteobacteria bacterium]|nr:HutD family protein [Pseudomonadota bacterium]
MAVRLLSERDYVRMPWLNGGGIATEFVKADIDPSERGPDETFLWRLSDADIDRSGPFSNYPGIDRFFMLLEGNGVTLDFGPNGVQRLQEKHRFVQFDGGWPTHCELIDGPARAFNLQTSRRHVEARHQVIQSGDANIKKAFPAEECQEATTRLVFVLDGEASITVGGDDAMALEKYATLVVEQDAGQPQTLFLSGCGFTAIVIDLFEKQT